MSPGDRIRDAIETWGALIAQLIFWLLLLTVMVLCMALPGCVTGQDRAAAQASEQQLERDAAAGERALALGQIDKAEFEALLSAALDRHERRLAEIRAEVTERTGSFVEHLADPSAWLRDLVTVGGGALILNRHRSRSRERQLADLRAELGMDDRPPAGPRRST